MELICGVSTFILTFALTQKELAMAIFNKKQKQVGYIGAQKIYRCNR